MGVLTSTEVHAFQTTFVDRCDDQLRRNSRDRGEQFPQVIHIELGGRIVQHQACRRCVLRCLECELSQDEGRSQKLLLTARDAVAGRRALEEE